MKYLPIDRQVTEIAYGNKYELATKYGEHILKDLIDYLDEKFIMVSYVDGTYNYIPI